MRKWIIFILFGCSLFACKEQEIDPYEGNSSIYFDDNNAGFYEVSWGTWATEIKEMKVRLKVNLFGMVKDYPRKFNIRVVSNETDTLHSVAGVDYKEFPLEYEMPAMENHTYIDINLLRTDTLRKQARRFTVYLTTNEEFGFEYMNYDMLKDSTLVMINNSCTIYMDEEFPRPGWWSRQGEPVFGEWSMKKGILICDVGEIDRAKFQADLDGKDGNLTAGFLKFLGRKVYLWLKEHTTLDEDDEPMEMGEESIY